MVDADIDAFLDSDDDALFLEASHHFLDDELKNETPLVPEASEKQSKITSSYFTSDNNIIGIEFQVDVSDTSVKDSNTVFKNTVNVSKKRPLESNINNASDCSRTSRMKCENAIKNILVESNISSKSNSDIFLSPPQTPSDQYVKVTSTSTESFASAENNSYSKLAHLNKSSIIPNTYINNRFTPGFTPKVTKRKLPGPAGLLELFNKSKEARHSEEMMGMDIENVISSQFTPEHLASVSWQKLQTAVSSCPDLHSMAKFYSIQRVLQESSKKKLPKHVVMPFLCVLLKRLAYKGSPTISLFMDDTGEIKGKIDPEVRDLYKEYLIEGTALILTKVTSLCNVLILKSENLVSLYQPNGTEKKLLSLDTVLKNPELLKPMNYENLKLSPYSTKNDKVPYFNTHDDNHKLSNIPCQTNFNNKSGKSKYQPETPHCDNTPKGYKPHNLECNKNSSAIVSNPNSYIRKDRSCSNSRNLPVTEASNHSTNVRSDEFLENLLDEDNCIDEFDELLGNLDEESFMADV